MSQEPGFDTRVAQFIALRDEIKRIEEEQKKILTPYKETLAQLNDALLGHLNSVGADNVAVKGVGTVYRKDKKSASLADKEAFWNWVVTQSDWDLLDYKANVTAVEEFIKSNKQAPPGVNFTVKQDVGVQRAQSSGK